MATPRDERTCYVTNFSPEVTDDIIKELFIQVGPVESTFFKKDDGPNRNFALVSFVDPESVLFAVETLDSIPLFNQPISVKPKNGTEQEKEYRRRLEERRNTNPQEGGSIGRPTPLFPPPPPPPIIPAPSGPPVPLLEPNSIPPIPLPSGPPVPLLSAIPLLDIPTMNFGGVHPSARAGYSTPPGYNNQYDWRRSSNSSSSVGSRSNSYERDDRNRWNYGGSGGGGQYRDYRNDRYRNDNTPNRSGGRDDGYRNSRDDYRNQQNNSSGGRRY